MDLAPVLARARRLTLVLDDAADPPAPKPTLTVRHVIAVVADYYGVSVSVLLARRRNQVFVRRRYVAFYLAQELTLNSLPQIGRHAGRYDHTTILHAVRKIAAQLAGDEQLATDVAALRGLLTRRFAIPERPD